MNLRIHLALLVFLVAAHSVNSSIDSSAAKVGVKAKALDDLYIDDEGDDDIQLQDQASGSGPLKPTRVDEVEEEEEEDNLEEDEDEDEEDSVPVVVEANKAKDVAPPVGVSSSDFKEDDAPSPPKVSPVAASPSGAAKPVQYDDDDEDEDEDYNVQGSGAGSSRTNTGGAVGRDSGSGAGSISGTDDDEEEEDYDETSVDEDVDITSVISEPERPRIIPPPTEIKPEKKPEVVVVAPPAPPATKAPAVPTTVTPPPMVEMTTPSTTVSVQTTPTTRAPIVAVDPGSDVHILDHKPEDRQASFFAQPGILAAVIGGAVVGLLCAILLVMFIVYRMRKKDEGSYVLDEPKRSSPNSNPYNKNSREFYA
nr:EOG090X0QLW [Eubosmina coregoni]